MSAPSQKQTSVQTAWRKRYLTSLVKREYAQAIKRYAIEHEMSYVDALDVVLNAGMTAMYIKVKNVRKDRV